MIRGSGFAAAVVVQVLVLSLSGCGGGKTGADEATLRDANMVFYSMPG